MSNYVTYSSASSLAKANRADKPRRYRFSVLEAAGAAAMGKDQGNDKRLPLPNAICKNCKRQDTLIQRPLIDPVHIFFCTHCGGLTPTRAVRRKRGLVAPAIQQIADGRQTGIAQPLASKKLIRTPHGLLHNANTDNMLVDSLTKKGFKVLDSQYIEPT